MAGTGVFSLGQRSGRDRVVEDPWFRHIGAKASRLHQGDEAHGPLDREGVGYGIWRCTGPRLQVLHEQV